MLQHVTKNVGRITEDCFMHNATEPPQNENDTQLPIVSCIVLKKVVVFFMEHGMKFFHSLIECDVIELHCVYQQTPIWQQLENHSAYHSLFAPFGPHTSCFSAYGHR